MVAAVWGENNAQLPASMQKTIQESREILTGDLHFREA
jgi:hypothetical protein